MKKSMLLIVCLAFAATAFAQGACDDGPGFSDGVWFYDPVTVGDCQCICSFDQVGTQIEIFGLGAGDPPNISVTAGCDDYPNCIHPAGYNFDDTAWLYTDGGAWNSWSNATFTNIGDGCFTICYEGRGEEEPCEVANLNIDPAEGTPQYFCLDVCPPQVGSLTIGPGLGQTDRPIVTFLPGCGTDTGCDNPDCTPSMGEVPADEWFYGGNGYWYADYQNVPGVGAGCTCLCFEGILPVELTSFDAIPGDRSVTLNWSTASETEHDHFDIERNDAVVGRVESEGDASGGNYTWTESELTNGTLYTYALIAVDVNGTRENMGTVSATPGMSNAAVSEYALHQNYPNPFNPETNITFDIAEAGHVTVAVYNALGQVVATLADGSFNAGRHTMSFDGTNLTSGLYFYRLEAGDFSAIRKMVLMK